VVVNWLSKALKMSMTHGRKAKTPRIAPTPHVAVQGHQKGEGVVEEVNVKGGNARTIPNRNIRIDVTSNRPCGVRKDNEQSITMSATLTATTKYRPKRIEDNRCQADAECRSEENTRERLSRYSTALSLFLRV
jgi:hypothetical protein